MKYYEDDNIELKREVTNEIKKEIIAFLNTNGGIIYIGVNDDGSIYKMLSKKEKDIEMTKIINWISQDIILPNPKDLIALEYNKDGVLEVVVSEGNNKPYYLKEYGINPKGVYIRYETSKCQANFEEIEKLKLESRKSYFEDTIYDKDNLRFNYLNNIKKDKLLSYISYNKPLFIDYIFSDNYNNRTKIFIVDNKNNIIKKKFFKGSIIKQIDDILLYFNKIYNIDYQYILKEALLNCYIHRDYSLRDNIRIEITPFKINFISPGGILDLSFDYYNKKFTRNKKVKHTLMELGYVTISKENGLKRIYKICNSFHIEPVIITTSKVFVLSIPIKINK